MKRRNHKLRKALLMTCCALALVAISVGATLAYLTDTEAVKNVFTVGQVGITLNEAPVDANGKETTGARVTENSYHMLPGLTYDKDPTVTMDANSEPAYVRMLVTVYGYNDLLKICQHHNSNDVVDGVVLLQNFTDWDSSKWEFVDVELSSTDYPMSATYEFRYIETEDDKTVKSATAYSLPPLFTEITVPDYMTNEDLEILGSEDIFTEYPKTTHGTGNVFMITVNAHAIQAAGFENAAEAWEAFEDQMN